MKAPEVKTVSDLRKFIVEEVKTKKPNENPEKVADAIMSVVKSDSEVQSFLTAYTGGL